MLDHVRIHIDRVDVHTCCRCVPSKQVVFHWAVGPVTLKKGTRMPLELTLTNEQQVLVTASPMTAGGHPATLDGPLVWTVESGDCTVSAQDADGLTALIVSGDALSDSVVMVAGDADLGAGVEEIKDTVLVHVQHANAASLGLSAGAPTLKP